MANLTVTLSLTATNPDGSVFSSDVHTSPDCPKEAFVAIQKIGLKALSDMVALGEAGLALKAKSN